jgi:hypothetical protein
MELDNDGTGYITSSGARLTLADFQNGVSFRMSGEDKDWAISVKLVSVEVAPKLLAAPSIVGDGRIGSEHHAASGEWSGRPEPALSFTWLRNGVEIAGATQQSFTPGADDDVCAIACRVEAHNACGSAVALTPPRTMIYPRPHATTTLLEEVFDRGTGVQLIDVSGFFSGEGLSFSVTGADASVEPATGVVSIATDAAAEAQEVVVTAQNSGGTASLTLLVTVEAEEPGRAIVGFAGPSMVQIQFGEGELSDPERLAVDGAGSYALDPKQRLGSVGAYNGVAGHFSGWRNTSEPQYFTPWPAHKSTEYTDLFAVTDPTVNRCLGDDAGKWQVEVNGAARTVTALHRKTIPTSTRLVDPSTWRSTRRHLVTLTLASPIAPDDVITVTPPGDLDPIHQIFRPDVVSEAVHVCHLGYPLGGPKRGYVGLWLGHDGVGASGTTDSALSASTAWRLVRVSDGVAVAGGTLALAKAQADDHMAGINFNGCDVYVADFSGFDNEGTYRLEIDGFGASVPFAIADQPYAEALRLAARAYFFQRSGCAITAQNGEGITRPRNGHPADGLSVYQTNVLLGRHSEG